MPARSAGAISLPSSVYVIFTPTGRGLSLLPSYRMSAPSASQTTLSPSTLKDSSPPRFSMPVSVLTSLSFFSPSRL